MAQVKRRDRASRRKHCTWSFFSIMLSSPQRITKTCEVAGVFFHRWEEETSHLKLTKRILHFVNSKLEKLLEILIYLV
jgi:hypothetical protein